MSEVWKRLPFDERYEVSDQGRVKSHVRKEPRLLVQQLSTAGGYCQVYAGGSTHLVHRLVMVTFVGPRPEGMEVRHLDGNPQNNRLENLAYGTRSENVQDTIAHDRHPKASLTHCRNGHELDRHTPGAQRRCPTCTREYHANYRLTYTRKSRAKS